MSITLKNGTGIEVVVTEIPSRTHGTRHGFAGTVAVTTDDGRMGREWRGCIDSDLNPELIAHMALGRCLFETAGIKGVQLRDAREYQVGRGMARMLARTGVCDGIALNW